MSPLASFHFHEKTRKKRYPSLISYFYNTIGRDGVAAAYLWISIASDIWPIHACNVGYLASSCIYEA